MKHVWLLIKIRLSALFYSMFVKQNRKTGAASRRSTLSTILMAFLFVFVLASFLMLGLSISVLMAEMFLTSPDTSWMFFTTLFVLGFLLMLFTGMFAAKSQLFDAKDNMLLLAMPIRPHHILISRMLNLYLSDLFFEMLILGPAVVVYSFYAKWHWAGAIMLLFGLLFVPLLALTFSCLLGWLLAWVSSRCRNKNLPQTIVAMVFMMGYFYICFSSDTMLDALMQNATQIGESLKGVGYPFYQLGLAVAYGRFLPFLIFSLIAILPTVLCIFIISRNFITIVTKNKSAKKAVFTKEHLKSEKASSPLMAFTKKEIKRFFSSFIYMMNAGIGMVMLAVIGVLMVVKSGDLLLLWEMIQTEAPFLSSDLPSLAAMAVAMFILSTNLISAPSVSLEGKQLWIPLSMPVRGNIPLHAKSLAHIAISALPTLLFSILTILSFSPSFFMALLVLILPQLFNAYMALTGTLLNLRFPKLDWLDETAPIKQSMSVGLMMGIGVLSAMILGGGLIALGIILPAGVAASLVCLVLIGITVGLYFIEEKAGPAAFANLSNK